MLDIQATLFKDVYKESHVAQVQQYLDRAYTTFTNRSGKHSTCNVGKVMSFGMQMTVLDFLIDEFDNFFAMDKEEALNTHFEVIESMVEGDHSASRKALGELHDLGYLPIRIKSIKEGKMVPYGMPTFTIKTTRQGFAWVGQSLETVISMEMWPLQTSATTALIYYRNFYRAAVTTGLDPEYAKFQAHDFSMRGLFGRHASVKSIAHLAAGNCGTDVIPAVVAAREFYGANLQTEVVGKSINATEHFVMCMGAGTDDSIEYYRKLITEDYPSGPISIVCDSKDFWKVVTEYFLELRDVVLSRDGVVVIRPDSGNPVRILCGYREDEIIRGETVTTLDGEPLMECEVKGLVRCLDEIYGHDTTDTGFKMLCHKVGTIYGDSISIEVQEDILARLIAMGYATTTVLGIGSYTYQYVTRDTHGSAMKGTAVQYKGDLDWSAIFKAPKTDMSKASQRGLIRIDLVDDEYVMREGVTEEEEEGGELEVVFEDGIAYNLTTLNEIRARAFEYV